MSYSKKVFLWKDLRKKSFRKNIFSIGKLCSSSKPGFIDNINKGIDGNVLKGGLQK